MPAPDTNQNDLELILDVAREADEIAMGYFKKDPEVWLKPGDSPVTEADMAIDTHLKKRLLEARPDYGWLSEETTDDPARMEHQRVFIVDPIDGTRGFIAGSDRWCISIAVVEKSRPVVGVLQCPVLKEVYASTLGSGAQLNEQDILLDTVHATAKSLRATGPKSMRNYLQNSKNYTFQHQAFVPSLAYRLAMIATDDVDVVFARPNAHDWDVAAVDLIVHEAGGRFSNATGERLIYNQPDTSHGALVSSAEGIHDDMVDLIRQLKKQIN